MGCVWVPGGDCVSLRLNTVFGSDLGKLAKPFYHIEFILDPICIRPVMYCVLDVIRVKLRIGAAILAPACIQCVSQCVGPGEQLKPRDMGNAHWI